MVMHSVSDHSLNIPSKKEVEKYLTSLDQHNHLEAGDKCSIPLTIRIKDCNCSWICSGEKCNNLVFKISLWDGGHTS